MVSHIGFIMDGNRRYATKNNLSLHDGYRQGMSQFLNVVSFCIEKNIPYFSFFAMSKDNYEQRNESELKPIKELIEEFFQQNEIEEFFQQNNVKINIKGKEITKNEGKELERKIKENPEFKKEDKEFLQELRKRFDSYNKKITQPDFVANIAFNYDGQQEIADACNSLIKKGKKDVTPEDIKKELYFSDIPHPDIIVRTGDAPRTSGFLLFDSKYSELYLSKKMWPELTNKDLNEILNWFSSIQRNFGK